MFITVHLRIVMANFRACDYRWIAHFRNGYALKTQYFRMWKYINLIFSGAHMEAFKNGWEMVGALLNSCRSAC